MSFIFHFIFFFFLIFIYLFIFCKIKDAENYAVLLSEIAKDTVAEEELVEAFKQKDLKKRAETVLRWASRIGCRKFVSADDIINVCIF